MREIEPVRPQIVLSDASRNVIDSAAELAKRSQDRFIFPAHLLHELVLIPQINQALLKSGIGCEYLRSKLKEYLDDTVNNKKEHKQGELGLSLGSITAIEQAIIEAKSRSSNIVEPLDLFRAVVLTKDVILPLDLNDKTKIDKAVKQLR